MHTQSSNGPQELTCPHALSWYWMVTPTRLLHAVQSTDCPQFLGAAFPLGNRFRREERSGADGSSSNVEWFFGFRRAKRDMCEVQGMEWSWLIL